MKPLNLMILTLALCLSLASGAATAEQKTQIRDGSHDFDFEMGKWKMHNRRLLQPLTGSVTWVEFDSYSVGSQLPGGIGNQDVYRTDYYKKGFVGLTYRLYDPRTGLWSIYWVDNLSIQGAFVDPVAGKFTGNTGVFEGPFTFKGKPALERYTWTVNPKGSAITAHFEQAFSADGGKTWETNFINDLIPDNN
ncbi:MAG TPA: hypothetical protein VGT99_06495 [Gammaproteobacteria bacterium]|nr:hypothetical protein [Gammaproteobacteria bacterium]